MVMIFCLRILNGGSRSGQPKSVVSKMNKDAQMRAAINQKLIETGERERLKELLRDKLIEMWLEGSVEGTL